MAVRGTPEVWCEKLPMNMRDTNDQGLPGDSDALASVVNELASYFAAKPGVQAAWLFGSHREGRSHQESDVDLAVLLEHARYAIVSRSSPGMGDAPSRFAGAGFAGAMRS